MTTNVKHDTLKLKKMFLKFFTDRNNKINAALHHKNKKTNVDLIVFRIFLVFILKCIYP